MGCDGGRGGRGDLESVSDHVTEFPRRDIGHFGGLLDFHSVLVRTRT